MAFLSHVNRSDLEPGDHIYVFRDWGYAHHGIYVGGDKVVHFGLNSNNSSSIFSSSSSGGGRVVMTCLNCFLESGSLRRYQYGVSTLAYALTGGSVTQKSDPPRKVIARALYLLRNGFREYDLATNNCEHFALYCKTGLIFGPLGEICGSGDTMDFGTVDILSAAELQGKACASCREAQPEPAKPSCVIL